MGQIRYPYFRYDQIVEAAERFLERRHPSRNVPIPIERIVEGRGSHYGLYLEAPVRLESSIRCGIEHGGVNDTDSKYASLAFYYVRYRVGLVQTRRRGVLGPRSGDPG